MHSHRPSRYHTATVRNQELATTHCLESDQLLTDPVAARSSVIRVQTSRRGAALNSEGAGLGGGSLGAGHGGEMHLPRIRRSPCETDSAAAKHGGNGTVE
jgi:hypothetical protein